MKRLLLLALLPSLLTCAPEPQAAKPTREWGEPSVLCRLDDQRVTESSGVAASTREDGVYFTHNDSGDGPRFFKFDEKGKALGAYEVRGAKATDWEEMASAKLDGKNYLFFADIGDNLKRRKSVQVYQVEEPKKGQMSVSVVSRYDLTYPDGAHNAEGFFVHPSTGDMYIVEKATASPVGLYRLARPPKGGSFKLEKVGTVTVDSPSANGLQITGSAISPDGKHVVIRTYVIGAFEYDVSTSVAEAFKTAPRRVKLSPEIQGESITYRRDGKALITTSEFAPCPVSLVPLLG